MDISQIQSVPSAKAASIMGVEDKTLEKWRREGTGPKFIKYSHRCVRYRLIDIFEFQEKHLKQNTIPEGKVALEAPDADVPKSQKRSRS